jgi:hypothetical protein
MADKPALKRVAFSPGEFAELFGKSQTWGYRQIYGGKVKAITEHGRILIPAAEVDKILGKAGVYDGMKPKNPRSKEELQKLAPQLKGSWQKFIEQRRGSGIQGAAGKEVRPNSVPSWAGKERQAALLRLAGKTKQKKAAGS